MFSDFFERQKTWDNDFLRKKYLNQSCLMYIHCKNVQNIVLALKLAKELIQQFSALLKTHTKCKDYFFGYFKSRFFITMADSKPVLLEIDIIIVDLRKNYTTLYSVDLHLNTKNGNLFLSRINYMLTWHKLNRTLHRVIFRRSEWTFIREVYSLYIRIIFFFYSYVIS